MPIADRMTITCRFFKLSFVWLILIYVICSSAATAAPTVENVSSNGVFNIAATTELVVPHNVAGTNRTLFVGVSTFTISGVIPPTGSVVTVTYGGQVMTRVTTADLVPVGAIVAPDNQSAVEIFRLNNPTAGTNDVTITVNPVNTVNYIVGGAISVMGAASNSLDFTALVGASGNNGAPSVNIPTAPDNLVLDVLGIDFDAQLATEGANQTPNYKGNNFFGASDGLNDIGASSAEIATGATTPMTWTITPNNWALGAISVIGTTTAAELTLGGTVTNRKGAPLSGVTITLLDAVTGELRRAKSDADGFYQFDNVDLNGIYQVRARRRNYTFVPDSQVFNLLISRDDVDFVGSIERIKSR